MNNDKEIHGQIYFECNTFDGYLYVGIPSEIENSTTVTLQEDGGFLIITI